MADPSCARCWPISSSASASHAATDQLPCSPDSASTWPARACRTFFPRGDPRRTTNRARRPMTGLKAHFAARGSASSLLTSRFSRHPERYFEIFRVLRKYHLHHIVAELGMSHHHDDDLDQLPAPNGIDAGRDGHAHGIQLACALEELGPCFIKLGQLLS